VAVRPYYFHLRSPAGYNKLFPYRVLGPARPYQPFLFSLAKMDADNVRHILGLPEMDEQHSYLYSLFDAIEPTAKEQNSLKLKNLLDEIERYLLFHFDSEERLMRSYGFEGFAVHQSDHESGASRFLKFVDDFDNGSLNPAALRIFLTGWLMEHSMQSDELYAVFIKRARRELEIG
jgi:hemerythrin